MRISPEMRPRELKLSKFQDSLVHLETGIELATTLEKKRFAELFALVKKGDINKSMYQAAYTYFLMDCGLFDSAKSILREIFRITSSMPQRRRRFRSDRGEGIDEILSKLELFESIEPKILFPEGDSEVREQEMRSDMDNLPFGITEESDLSQMENLNEILSILISSIAYVLKFPDKNEKSSNEVLEYLKYQRRISSNYLNKRKEKIRQTASEILEQADLEETIIENQFSRLIDNKQPPPNLENSVQNLFFETMRSNLSVVKNLSLQLVYASNLIEEFQTSTRVEFFRKYWILFIEDINSSSHILDIFKVETVQTPKEIMYYLLLKDIYAVSAEDSVFYDELISLLNKCHKKEFAYIQQKRFACYKAASPFPLETEPKKALIDFFGIIRAPFSISDLNLMRIVEINVCGEIFNLWFSPLKKAGLINLIDESFKKLLFNFFKNEQIEVCAKLLSCFYLMAFSEDSSKEQFRNELVDKIYQIVTILVDKRNEREFVDMCVESLKIIQFFTEKESRVLESAKLIQSVWKDENIIENIQNYLKNIKKSRGEHK